MGGAPSPSPPRHRFCRRITQLPELSGTRRVEEDPLRHAIAAFWFYLAHESTGENRLKFLANAKQTLRRG